MKKLILASASPRRSELLENAGIAFEVRVSGINEKTEETEPEKVVCDLSRQKCLNVAEHLSGSYLVLGADTVVACEGIILGKPVDGEDAARMLRHLSGKVHKVYTGVTLSETEAGKVIKTETLAVSTDVWVAQLSEEEIRRYVDSGEPLDKAGSYGIQGQFARHIARIEGDYSNVVGLPVHTVYRMLREWGTDAEVNGRGSAEQGAQ